MVLLVSASQWISTMSSNLKLGFLSATPITLSTKPHWSSREWLCPSHNPLVGRIAEGQNCTWCGQKKMFFKLLLLFALIGFGGGNFMTPLFCQQVFKISGVGNECSYRQLEIYKINKNILLLHLHLFSDPDYTVGGKSRLN